MAIKRISPIDAGFLLIERKDVPVHVSLLMLLTKPADAGPDYVAGLKEQMRGPHLLAPPWNLRPMRFADRLPFMREVTELDFDYHVRLYTLPGPGGQRELGELVARIHPVQLSKRHPLWQINLIDGLTDNQFALQFKGHHAIFDGTTFMRRIVRWLSDDPEARNQPPLFTIGPPGRTSSAPGDNGGRPSVRRVFAELRRAGKAAKEGVFEGEPLAAPYRRPGGLFAGRIDNGRRFAFQQYDLSEIKALGKAAGSTVNDLLIWLAATSLRTYLIELGKLPDQSLNTAVAVNLRAADDDRPGSAFGTIVVDLATQIADPLERLRAITRSSATAKKQIAALSPVAQTLQSAVVLGRMMGALIMGCGRFTPSPFNLTMSNVPGPRQQKYLEGARVDMLAPIHILWHNGALNVTGLSHADKLTVGITGATKTVPHVQRLATAMGEALVELRSLVLPERPEPAESEG